MVFRYLLGSKGGRCVGLTTLPRSCADCMEILGVLATWNPKGVSSPVCGSLFCLCRIKTHVPLTEIIWFLACEQSREPRMNENRWKGREMPSLKWVLRTRSVCCSFFFLLLLIWGHNRELAVCWNYLDTSYCVPGYMSGFPRTVCCKVQPVLLCTA